MLTCLSDIRHAVYINLDARTDRRAQMEAQLEALGLSQICTRFPAISTMRTGAIGCTMSHLSILQTALAQKWPHVLIMEDDIHFLQPGACKHRMRRAFAQLGDDWDVLLLAGNVIHAYESEDAQDAVVRVRACQTTTGYLVNGPYIPYLIKNIKDGLLQLMRNPRDKSQFAIDRYWFSLQAIHRWYLLVPLQITQRPGYSDIECGYTDYSSMMLRMPPLWKGGKK